MRLKDEIAEIRISHSCYVCHDEWKSKRQKCSAIDDQIISAVKKRLGEKIKVPEDRPFEWGFNQAIETIEGILDAQ